MTTTGLYQLQTKERPISKAERERLRGKGFSLADIARMNPAKARQIISVDVGADSGKETNS